MNAWKKIACAALAVAMLLVAGCSGADLSWSHRSGEIQPPIGVYIFYLVRGSNKAETEWHELHDAAEADHEHPPYKQMLAEVLPDGRTIEQYMLEDADQSMREYIAVEQRFAAQGLLLTEQQINSATTSAASAWANDQDNYTRLGIAESSLRLVMLNQFKSERLFQASYGVSGDLAVPQSEVDKAMESVCAQVEITIFHTGESDDATAALEEAGEYKKRLDAGEDFYDLVLEREIKLAEENGELDPENPIERPGDGELALVLSENNRQYYGDTLTDAGLMIGVGETAIAQEGSFVYLLRRIEYNPSEEEYELYSSQALHSLRDDAFKDTLAAWADELSITTNAEALARYQPANLKLD